MGYVLEIDNGSQTVRVGANAEDVNYGSSNVKTKLDSLQSQLDNIGSGGSGGSTDVTINGSAPLYKNNPYPYGKDVLKILAIGNSFTAYPCDYLSGMLTASGCDASKICLYTMWESGYSLDNWANDYANNSSRSITRVMGSASVANASGSKSVAQQLAKDWDVVVFQEVSNRAQKFSNFNPSLKKLVQAVRRHCLNPNVAIAWQQVWTRKKSGTTNYSDVVAATQSMAAYNGIDIIVPSGTAIENARGISQFANVENTFYLTEDGVHPSWGVGKYVASCAWWETLIAPHYGVSILGNTYTHPSATGSAIDIDYSNTSGKYAGIPVTDANRELCQLCAVYAVGDMYNVTTGID